MKELQKYFFDFRFAAGDNPGPYYLASEADAAFAAEIAELKREHAEEIERLREMDNRADTIIAKELQRLANQAERYEKLRAVSLPDYPSAEAFDSYVDQLPASGEK